MAGRSTRTATRLGLIALLGGSALVLAACGQTTGDRAIGGAGTGAAAGAATGAVLGGGVGAAPGAAIGAAAGGATGASTDESQIDLGEPPWR